MALGFVVAQASRSLGRGVVRHADFVHLADYPRNDKLTLPSVNRHVKVVHFQAFESEPPPVQFLGFVWLIDLSINVNGQIAIV